MGIATPTPVQARAIPLLLEGKDLIATAQTGTGKTLAFALPSLTRLCAEKQRRNRMLVLVPTRELCVQVESVIAEFNKALQLRSVQIYGGVSITTQATQLRNGCDIIVATPGRLLDHVGRGNVQFNELEILVFDEADRMLDMGFLPDIQRILAKLPKERQTMMFSATFADEVEVLSRAILREPERIEIGFVTRPVDAVHQVLVPAREDQKSTVLLGLLNHEEIDSGIIFLRTKMRTDRIGKMLKKAGYGVAIIHGDLSQPLRQRALEGFRSGKYRFLVATDVAARGLDVDDVSHVINYDIPPTADDYVHRVGRTARADKKGDAITFVTPSEFAELANIEKALGRNLPRREYSGAPIIPSLWSPPGSKRPVARRGRGMMRRK
jgi:ATP-dependent RNA helicase RhlE